MTDRDACTHDTLLRGRVHLFQPRDGFRSSLDPVLLAGFIDPPFGHFLDIGCASGALSFLLLARDEKATGVGVEIQPRLAGLAERGRGENAFGSRLRIVGGDARAEDVLPDGGFDLVATNPPFRPLGSGVLPPMSEKALAHHEVSLTLADWLGIARRALRPEGRLTTIFPFDREQALRAGLAAHGLGVERSRLVFSRQDAPPSRVLMLARRSAAPEIVQSPLVVHENGHYTAEVRRMLGEET